MEEMALSKVEQVFVPYTKDKLNKTGDVRKSNIVGYSRNH
jgi:hypothetical protein